MISSLSRKLLVAVGLLGLLVIIVAATFPIGWFRDRVEQALSRHVGAPVKVGKLEREGYFSFNPVIRLTDTHISQPAWAGPGELASVRQLRFRVQIIPLLFGRVNAQLAEASDIRLDLVRAANGRVNWSREEEEESEEGSGAIDLSKAIIDNARIRYRDAVQRRTASITVHLSPQKGLVAKGDAMVDGAPVRLSAHGAPMGQARPWPFSADMEGARLAMHVEGTMAAPLRFDSMAFRVKARADDLKRIDRVIEAGLFGTRAVDLTGNVRHEDDTWFVDHMAGSIGRSRFAGHITARKADGRVRLDGNIRFAQIDFDDLASESGNARAMAMERRDGLRLVPNTRIDIHKMHETDGRIAIRVDHVLAGRRPTSLTSVEAVLDIDHLLLKIDPLRIGLSKGAITGQAIVDQRGGADLPHLTLALDMTNSSIGALAGGGDVYAKVDGRVRLAGRGSTIREAVGRSDGSVAIVARRGVLPEKIAAMLGFDMGRAVLGDDEDRAGLRCAVLRLDMKNGRGTMDPLLIDTSISQTRGTGTIRFPEETIAASLIGAPKADATLRVPGSVHISGRIREPEIMVPKEVKSVGNLLKAIGRKISGDDGDRATDADCSALSRQALR